VENRVCVILFIGMFIPFTLLGCSSSDLFISYTGGGLPPGDGDIGGVVLAEVPSGSVAATQATTPVQGAEALLFRSRQRVGRAVTSDGGYFRFENPHTGQYQVVVNPPPGSGLRQAQRQFQHTLGQQTFLTITLEPEE